MKSQYHDMCLTCVGCLKNFDFPTTEQDFFAKHGLEPPKRCRECRAKKQKSLNPEKIAQTELPAPIRPAFRAKELTVDQISSPTGSNLFLELIKEITRLREDIAKLSIETKELKKETGRLYSLLEEDISFER